MVEPSALPCGKEGVKNIFMGATNKWGKRDKGIWEERVKQTIS